MNVTTRLGSPSFHNNVGSHARVNFGGANQPRLGRKEPNMIIIGCDYHPGFQQIAFVDTDTGEWNERRLGHREEAEQFYRQLQVRGKKCGLGWKPVGMRAGLSGYSPSCSLNCGSGMQPRSAPNGCANRKPIARMASCYCDS